jgi:hypothetical protein
VRARADITSNEYRRACAAGGIYKPQLSFQTSTTTTKTPGGIRHDDKTVKEKKSGDIKHTTKLCWGKSKTLRGIKTRKSKKSKAKQKRTKLINPNIHPSSPAAVATEEKAGEKKRRNENAAVPST